MTYTAHMVSLSTFLHSRLGLYDQALNFEYTNTQRCKYTRKCPTRCATNITFLIMIAAMRKYYSYTFVINVCHRMCKGIKNILHSSVLKAVRMSPLIVNACVKLFLVRLKYFIQKQLSKICKITLHLRFLSGQLKIYEKSCHAK